MAVAQYRAIGPRSASLPQATANVIGFLRDPNRFPYLDYTQLVPLENVSEGLYRFPTIEPDEAVRLINYYEFGWGWDDKRPSGETFKPRITWTSSETIRWAFGYTLGERTNDAWKRNTKINPQNLYDKVRMAQAGLHRASRVVDKIRNFAWTASQTSTLQALFGSPGIPLYFDKSSGTELLSSDVPNPNFQVIKRTLNIIIRQMNLATNGAISGNELCMVMGPFVAQKIAESGEIVNYLKQQANARNDLMTRNGKWGIPDNYAGWKLIVEDTPRVFVRPNLAQAVGTGNVFASQTTALTTTPVGFVTTPYQRDYIWNDDSVFFGSRAGGLDGHYGEVNFSTVQLFHYNGLANVQARSDQWNQIIEGSIDLEDDIQVAAPLAGYWLTNTTSTGIA